MKNSFAILLMLLSCCIIHAQPCSNGLGVPIVDITFGAGTNQFGNALASGITNMQYVANQCPEDGTYTITNRTDGCYAGDWLNINADHTGDANGYFMLINASVAPSDFYLQTISGLCPSTSYQFAAWVLNMAAFAGNGRILPNVTFNIEKTDGTVLQSFQTGDIPAANPAAWVQYAFYFTTPPGISTVVLRMRNNAPGGYGNDLAIDDITFRTSGPSVIVNMVGYGGNKAQLCANAGNTLQFAGVVGSCYPSTDYQWQESTDSGSTWNDVQGAISTNYLSAPTTAGNYLFRLAAAQTGNIGLSSCQVVSLADTIVVLPMLTPSINIGLDGGYACVDSLSSFTADPVNGGTIPMYQWYLNYTPVGNGLPTYNNSSLSSGDQIMCELKSNAPCPVINDVTSNIITMQVMPTVDATIGIASSANNICQDSLVAFTATPSKGGDHPAYQWLLNGQPVGSDTSVYSSAMLNEGDVVSAVLTSSLHCAPAVSSNTIAMTVYIQPHIQLTPDTIIAGGSQMTLEPAVTGPVTSYQWTPSASLNDPSIADPIARPIGTTTYTLSASTGDGCTAVAAEKVIVFYDLNMPNAFTPNGDGRNDVFRIPPSITVTILQFAVYDRWGRLLFSTANSGEGWDGSSNGQLQPTDTYVWEVEYYNPLLKKVMMKKGTVVLIR